MQIPPVLLGPLHIPGQVTWGAPLHGWMDYLMRSLKSGGVLQRGHWMRAGPRTLGDAGMYGDIHCP